MSSAASGAACMLLGKALHTHCACICHDEALYYLYHQRHLVLRVCCLLLIALHTQCACIVHDDLLHCLYHQRHLVLRVCCLTWLCTRIAPAFAMMRHCIVYIVNGIWCCVYVLNLALHTHCDCIVHDDLLHCLHHQRHLMLRVCCLT